MINYFWKNITSKPKVAVLIVGEYRTFPNCRKTMLFLNQPELDIDVYVSTWDQTNTLNPEVSTLTPTAPIYQPVTKEQIEKDIGIPITCAIHKREEISAILPIIRGWLLGFDLLRKSSKQYDYVLLLRPDTFFENVNDKFNSYLTPNHFKKYKTRIGVRPTPDLDGGTGALPDNLFFSTYDNLDKFFTKLFDYWELNGTTHRRMWHEMLYTYVTEELKLSFMPPPITAQYVIARYPINENTTFNEAEQLWRKWFRENNRHVN